VVRIQGSNEWNKFKTLFSSYSELQKSKLGDDRNGHLLELFWSKCGEHMNPIEELINKIKELLFKGEGNGEDETTEE